MRKARTNASRRIYANWSIRRSASIMAGSSRPPATACWRNSPASSTRCAAPPKSSARWPTAIWISPRMPSAFARRDVISFCRVNRSAVSLSNRSAHKCAPLELIAAEAARPTEHPDALDYILRGRAALMKPPSRDNYREMVGLFEHALALDRQSTEAQSWLARVLSIRVPNAMTDSPAADLARADGLIGQALAVSPRSADVHFVKGQVLRAQRRWEEAIPEYETALALDRNLVLALSGLAWCKL